jgi:hypothetical protein
LAHSLRIETLDRSGRWYLTPGSRSIYDLRVRNDAKETADCSIFIEDPATGVTVDPPTFKLCGHEVRTVTVLFSEDAKPTRSQRVLMRLCDDSGADLAVFEHPLLVAGLTDCNITLSFKDVTIEGGALAGFSVCCALRSQSEGPATFSFSWASHPALSVPDLPAVGLEPGEGTEVVIPVRWNQAIRDGAGINHPRILEVGVPVSNGKRTARLRWETIEPKLNPSAWKSPAPNSKSGVAAPSPQPQPAPAQAAPPQAAPPQPMRAQPVPPPKSSVQPPRKQPTVARPTAPVTRQSSQIAAANPTSVPTLLLCAPVEVRCLPNPAPVAASPAALNGATSKDRVDSTLAAVAAAVVEPPQPAGDVSELTLFSDFGLTKPVVSSTSASSAAVVQPALQGTVQPSVTSSAPAPQAATTASQPAPTAPAQPPASAAQPASAAAAQTPAQADSSPEASVAPALTPATTPMLTRYTPVHWDTLASAVVSAPREVKPASSQQDITVTPPRTTATVIRTRSVPVQVQKLRIPAGVLFGGLAAVAAIAIAAVLFKPSASTAPVTLPASSVAVTTTAPVNVVKPALPQPVKHTALRVAHKNPKVALAPTARPTVTPQPTAAPTQAAQTPHVATPRPATARPAAAHHQAPSWSAPVARPQPPQAVSQSVVALGGIEAYYGPRGHAVRVLWSADEQASASVQLIDERGAIVSATTVRGNRQNALLYLPRRFHGPLTVQVSSVGRLGERVAQTTSLAAFGY